MQFANRKYSRSLLFQKLYSKVFSETNDELFKESFMEEKFKDNFDEKYFTEMYEKILQNENFYINLIQKFAPKFDIEKMNLSYILPIFIGACEMLDLTEEIPGIVSINEAVEITKKFGDESARRIVNGVLNNILKNIEEIKKGRVDFISSEESIFMK